MSVLGARIRAAAVQKRQKPKHLERRNLLGSGDRSDVLELIISHKVA